MPWNPKNACPDIIFSATSWLSPHLPQQQLNGQTFAPKPVTEVLSCWLSSLLPQPGIWWDNSALPNRGLSWPSNIIRRSAPGILWKRSTLILLLSTLELSLPPATQYGGKQDTWTGFLPSTISMQRLVFMIFSFIYLFSVDLNEIGTWVPKEGHTWQHHYVCVFCVFRAFNILNGYVQSVQVERAQNSDSETPVKKYNRSI